MVASHQLSTPNSFDRDLGWDLGSLETKVEILEEDISLMRQDIKEIRDTITGVKGSWKALLAVGSILSGIFVTIGMKVWDVFGSVAR